MGTDSVKQTLSKEQFKLTMLSTCPILAPGSITTFSCRVALLIVTFDAMEQRLQQLPVRVTTRMIRVRCMQEISKESIQAQDMAVLTVLSSHLAPLIPRRRCFGTTTLSELVKAFLASAWYDTKEDMSC